ncbi:NAD(P)-dependent oxidoreductase [Candidatus Poribacteria bacterium]|jgi:nucleoside-diphosphate-sugar epimerase|nr:NAD(P)-dependent oxidoreductase [Candidatus Poribacteria bacterium]MBT5711618.1 NAD(P)-dependent oxidoreductase [Candidatus Poribacteria bacterium]MBT7096972.1 NAD(P)-dependent oxidoreductase [Candidatus Poribacteria bacterium]MBT7806061.1 NAD(P)-dependent oxidoreductase [Candidatus Poribacteria bacterium]
MRVLITGTSGFVGAELARSMSGAHDVVCLSRKPTDIEGVTTLQGDFATEEGLALVRGDIDAVVHLAAVTGAGTERDCMAVNVLGTHSLLRALIDRGCRKFVLASSIAAVGFQSVRFRPLQIPIPDEHPCLDRDGYGVSKYLMEEVTRYVSRQEDEVDIINIRLASVIPEDSTPSPVQPGPVRQWSIGAPSLLYVSDAVRCFRMAAESPRKPGVRIMNAVGAQACVAAPVPEILRAWYGADADSLDMSHYERPGHERDPLYSIDRVREEIGFTPARSVLPE